LLEARLEAALVLVQTNKVERLLLSGYGTTTNDEISVMRDWLVARGVPAERLLLDREGVRTLASLVRAKEAFGLNRLAIVTNPFHLPRALFLARRLGLDAVGVAARPRVPVSRATSLRNLVRELAAQWKAVAEGLLQSPSATGRDAGG